MAIERVSGFEADEEDMIFYNRQAILDLAIEYEFEDETLYTFPGYQSSFLNVYDSQERNTLEKQWTNQITRNSNVHVINASVSDCTFSSNGTRYYELGYVRSGYSIVLRYGKLIIK